MRSLLLVGNDTCDLFRTYVRIFNPLHGYELVLDLESNLYRKRSRALVAVLKYWQLVNNDRDESLGRRALRDLRTRHLNQREAVLDLRK